MKLVVHTTVIRTGDSTVASEIGFRPSAGATSPVSKRLGAPLYISSKAPCLFARDLPRYEKILLYHNMSPQGCAGRPPSLLAGASLKYLCFNSLL